MNLRLKKRGEKALERALVVSTPEEPTDVAAKRWKGYPDEETIPESDEPPNTPGVASQKSQQ